MRAYVGREHVTVPMAIVGKDVLSFYEMRGFPDAAVVAHGSVVWRGHPSFLPDEVLEGLLGAR